MCSMQCVRSKISAMLCRRLKQISPERSLVELCIAGRLGSVRFKILRVADNHSNENFALHMIMSKPDSNVRVLAH